MSPWAPFVAALVMAGACTAAYLQGRADGKDIQLAEAVRDEQVAAIASDAAASAAAAAIQRISVTHRTVRQELEREIIEKPVYRNPDCRTGPDSLRRFNAAIPAAGIAASPDRGAVPASDAGH